ncbi:MAG: Rossmann-like and DUF2520 domain-containing protein [Candidatus Sulfotelmatobacter sp.]
MLPGMAGKARIAIVGAGNLGSALAVALRRAGYTIDAVVTHSRKSQVRAGALGKQVGARVMTGLAESRADVVWLCVPDAEIARAADSLAPQIDWKKKVALHSSGALTSDALSSLRARGAAVASVHPLMTFVRGSRPSLAGVPFAIEGDAAAMRVARRMVRALGGKAHTIRKNDKAAYHAWGTFASPLLTALLVTTEQVAGEAGVRGKEARGRMAPILRQTLENYVWFGAADAFSGPIIRGDVETVKKHLRVLRERRTAREVYLALARAALEFLPAKNKTALRRALRFSGQ